MANKTRPYHIVVELIDSKWSVQFGDYDKAVAKEEMNELRDAQRSEAKSRKEWNKFEMITLDRDTQIAIDVTMCEMNGEAYKGAAA